MLSVSITKKIADFNLDISFQMEEEIMSIIGFSGSGKSLTLQCVAGLLTPDHGTIIMNNQVFFDSESGVNLLPEKRNIGFVFQSYALFPHLTVKENIAYSLRPENKDLVRNKTEEMLALTEMMDYQNQYPSTLSGGQKQRVAIARALASSPDLLLLDEPFSALDSMVKDSLEYEMIKLLAAYKIPTLFVTHNMAEAYKIGKRMAVFDCGQIIQSGPKEQVLSSPNSTRSAYLTGTTNLFPAEIEEENPESVTVKITTMPLSLVVKTKKNILYDQNKRWIGFRPEDLLVSSEKFHRKANSFNAKIVNVIDELHFRRLHLSFGHQIINAIVNKNESGNLFLNQYVSVHLPEHKIKLF